MVRGVCLTAVLGLSAAGAHATITPAYDWSNNQQQFDSLVSATDLINRGQATFLNTTGSDIGYGSSGPDGDGVSGANDGEVSSENEPPNGLAKVAYYTNGPSSPFKMIFNLNLDSGSGGSPTGYDITGATVINGWGSYKFYSDQIWTLAVATVAAPTTYVDLYSVNYIASAFISTSTNASVVSLTDTGPLSNGSVTATGIASVRFTITSAGGGGSVNREIDVFGSPTPVPEPASAAALLIGLGAFAVRRKKR